MWPSDQSPEPTIVPHLESLEGGGTVAHPADLGLVRAVLAQEPRAVEQFTARMKCLPRYVAVCNARAGRPLRTEEAEDTAQDVAILVWRKLSLYRGDATLETWAFRFCDLELRNAARKALMRRAPSVEDLAERGMVLPAAMAAVDEAEQVHAALARLPADEAMVMRLKHFEGLTFDEIGTRQAISPNTVKTRYYRALAAMRAQLGPKNEEP